MDGFFMHARSLLERTASDKRLTAADRQILDVAMLHTRSPGLPVGLGIDFLIAESQLARRTVIRARRHLTEMGYLILGDSGKRGLSCFIVATGASGDTCTGATDDTQKITTGAMEDTGTGATGDTGTSVVDGTHIDTGNIETVYAPANVKNRTTPKKPRVTFKDGTFGIPDAARAAWEMAYPQTDLDGEIAKAAAWLVVNGGDKKDYGRFLTNWLARSERWRLEREGPPVEEYTEEQLADNRRRGEELMAEELRRHELGIPDWEACPI